MAVPGADVDAARANHHSRPEIGSHCTKYGSRDGRRRQSLLELLWVGDSRSSICSPAEAEPVTTSLVPSPMSSSPPVSSPPPDSARVLIGPPAGASRPRGPSSSGSPPTPRRQTASRPSRNGCRRPQRACSPRRGSCAPGEYLGQGLSRHGLSRYAWGTSDGSSHSSRRWRNPSRCGSGKGSHNSAHGRINDQPRSRSPFTLAIPGHVRQNPPDYFWGGAVRSSNITKLRVFEPPPKAPCPVRGWKTRRTAAAAAVVLLSAVVGLLNDGLGILDHLTDGGRLTLARPQIAEQVAPLIPVESDPTASVEPVPAPPPVEPAADLREPRPPDRSSGVELPLNILVFDAVGSHSVLNIVVEELRRRYPLSTIDSQFDWRNKSLRSTTLIVWQGGENRPFALCLQEQLTGRQRAERRSWRWDFDAVRDIALFVGEDWRNVARGLRTMLTPCGRSGPVPLITPARVLECLDRESVRATYGSIADVLGMSRESVPALLGKRSPLASRVVSEPTDYSRHSWEGLVWREADLLELLDSCEDSPF